MHGARPPDRLGVALSPPEGLCRKKGQRENGETGTNQRKVQYRQEFPEAGNTWATCFAHYGLSVVSNPDLRSDCGQHMGRSECGGPVPQPR